MEKFLKKYYKHIVFVILALFFTVSALNANNDSATFDEVAHIPAGYSYVTEHDTRINPEHPPLIKDMTGFPLLFMNLNFDTSQKFWTGELPNLWDEGQWVAGKHLLYEAGNDPNKIIFWSRIPIVILSVILGLFLFMWGKEIAGITAGLFTLALYAFDPNILGHNHFVTTDIGIAAFLTFAFYFFIKFLKDPSWKNVALAGIFTGLLLVSKFSSIVAIPVFGLVLPLYALAKNNRNLNNWKTRISNLGIYIGKGIVALSIAMVVVWVVYEINTFAMPKETLAKTIEFFFSADDTNIKTIYTNKILHALNASDITRPWGAYMLGPAWVFKRVSGGNGAYFLGQVGNGFTLYFPIVFAIKETLPFLFLSLFSIIYTLKQTAVTIIGAKSSFRKLWKALGHFLRSSVLQYTLFIFIAIYAFLSIKGGLNIGFRHLFPILPFAYILITKKVFEFIKTHNLQTRHIFSVIVSVLVVWQIGAAALAYPSYTSYFNEIIGSSGNGYKYVTDSNTDWGQDLKRLDKWIIEHNKKAQVRSCSTAIQKANTDCIVIDKIRVDYFGGGNPKMVLGDKYLQWWDSKRPVEKGWYAISANFRQGSIYDSKRTSDENYAWTEQYEPVTMIGNSIFIYYIEELPQQ